MKSLVIAGSIMVSFGLLFAGGNMSPVASIVEPNVNCYPDDVFLEENAQLMWQDQQYTDKEDGAYKRNHSYGKAGSWGHADHYCKRLNYAGYGDWRLPTSDELQHVHRIPGQVFKYYRGRDFWSSTPASAGKYYAVYPADAYRYERKTKRSNYIRCVRCTADDIVAN